MPKDKKPPGKASPIWRGRSPGGKVPAKAATTKAATTKAAAIAASKARGDAVRAAGKALPTAPKYATKQAAIAASKARGNAARTAKAATAGALRDKAMKQRNYAKKAVTTAKNRQEVGQVARSPESVAADPLNWAAIARDLGNAGHPAFAAYATGDVPSKPAQSYTSKTRAKP